MSNRPEEKAGAESRPWTDRGRRRRRPSLARVFLGCLLRWGLLFSMGYLAANYFHLRGERKEQARHSPSAAPDPRDSGAELLKLFQSLTEARGSERPSPVQAAEDTRRIDLGVTDEEHIFRAREAAEAARKAQADARSMAEDESLLKELQSLPR